MTIKTYNMKTKYLIPQTEATEICCETSVLLLGTPTATEPGKNAPQRGGFAPGGGDLGGVPAN